MPIRAELKPMYGPDWRALSRQVRFDRAQGRCERCRRPHGREVLCLPDGRWQDPVLGWLDGEGRRIQPPPNAALLRARVTRVVLSTAHRDHDPRNQADENLAAWCQRCHLAHDAAHHRVQRWLRHRSRRAIADLFLGPYAAARYPLELGDE